MFLKTLRSLWRRIVMGDEIISNLFDVDDEGLTVKDWADALMSHTKPSVHKACSVTSIIFCKESNAPGHEYLQFTVSMKKENGKLQEAKFETHRTVDLTAKPGTMTAETSSAHSIYAAKNGANAAPPVLESPARVSANSITSVSSILGTLPAYDFVRKYNPKRCQRDKRKFTQEYEFGKLPVVVFSILLRSVSQYKQYRLLNTQCYWYTYVVYALAKLYSVRPHDNNDSSILPAELLKEAKEIAERSKEVVFPTGVGKFVGFIPILRNGNHAEIWEIFQRAKNDYTDANPIALKEAFAEERAEERAAHEADKAAALAEQQARYEADIAELQARVEELERQA